MRIGSLFSGIGGLELGLEMAGVGDVAWQVELDPWCRAVLARHWPNADRSVCDVTEAGPWNLEQVEVICGGFPCQDVSCAGIGAGLSGARSGLWREYLRIVDECKPTDARAEAHQAAPVDRDVASPQSSSRGTGRGSWSVALGAAGDAGDGRGPATRSEGCARVSQVAANAMGAA